MGKNKHQKYDIFISYRRDGGENDAGRLRLALEKIGYRVFMDRTGMHSGEFNTQLDEQLSCCKDVLLICSKGSMERCSNEEDWVRKEILSALEKKKNIIPVWTENFSPDEFESLPKEMSILKRLQAISIQNAAYEESVQKIATYLHSKPVKKYYYFITMIIAIFSILVSAVSAGWAFISRLDTGFPSGKKETELVSGMQSIAAKNLNTLDINLSYLKNAVDKIDSYVSGYNDNSAEVEWYLNKWQEDIEEQKSYDNSSVENEISYKYYSYLIDLYQLTVQSEDYIKYIDYMKEVVFDTPLGTDEKKDIMNNFYVIVEQDAEIAACETFMLFLKVDDPNTTLEDIMLCSADWEMIPAIGKSWIKGENNEEELIRRINAAERNKEEALNSIQSTSGILWDDYALTVD